MRVVWIVILIVAIAAVIFLTSGHAFSWLPGLDQARQWAGGIALTAALALLLIAHITGRPFDQSLWLTSIATFFSLLALLMLIIGGADLSAQNGALTLAALVAIFITLALIDWRAEDPLIWRWAIGVAAFALTAIVATLITRWVLVLKYPWTAAIAVFIALAVPVTLITMREGIRARRQKILNDLIEDLDLNPYIDLPPQGRQAIEFAQLKYGTKPRGEDDTQGSPPTLANARAQQRGLLALFGSAIPYFAFSIIGFLLLLEPICVLVSADTCEGHWIQPALLWTEQKGLSPADPPLFNAVAIAAAAFIGAYIFTLKYLFRAVISFELTPVSFLRAAIHLIFGVVLAVILYRALKDSNWISAYLGGKPGEGAPSTSQLVNWIVLAFFTGFIPDFAWNILIRKFRIGVKWYTDPEVFKAAKPIPIEVIDGVDYFVRYRLEENNVTDAQNLATYNPLLLFIETPYGLFETFDWVLQAQLCIVVGSKKFQTLKDHNIRTILDLKGVHDGPDGYIRMVGKLLFPESKPAGATDDSGSPPTPMDDEQTQRAPSLDVDDIKHAVKTMCDDPYVKGLEQLWDYVNGIQTPSSPP